MAYPYILQGDNLTLVMDNVPHTINKTHLAYTKLVEAIKQGLWDTVKELVNPTKAIVNYSKGNLSVVDGELFWKNEVFHNSLATRIVKMLEDGFDIDPMVNFMNNLMLNPSHQSVTELYGFLEKNNLPITPDGHFLAYKKVRADYRDVYSGTMDNSVGKIVEMERNKVDDNRNNECSTGLHFCSHSYLASFGGERTVIVKINPADVVSIPSDYDNAKGRACRYEVIGEVSVAPDDKAEFNKPVQSNANSVKVVPANNFKTGVTEFYRGYSDGFYDSDYDPDFNQDYDEGYDKGTNDRQLDNSERYRYVGIKTKVDPKFSDHAKTGSTPFYSGYTDGFLLAPYNYNYDGGSQKANNDFYEGYKKGESDRINGVAGRYRYAEPKLQSVNHNDTWPFPVQPKP